MINPDKALESELSTDMLDIINADPAFKAYIVDAMCIYAESYHNNAMAEEKRKKNIRLSNISLLVTGFVQVYFVAVNTFFLAKEISTAVIVD